MSKKDFIKLPQAELEIMLIIWNTDEAVSSTYILDKFKEKREWALPTLMTVLTRLVSKGFLLCEKEGRNNRYKSAISGDDYKNFYISNLVDDMFDGDVSNLLKSLIASGKLTADQIIENVRNLA